MQVAVHDNANPDRPPVNQDMAEKGFTIGRDENCDVRLVSPFVSSLHARVDLTQSGWQLSVERNAEEILVSIANEDGQAENELRLPGGKVFPLFEKSSQEELVFASRYHVRLIKGRKGGPVEGKDASSDETQAEHTLRAIHKALLRRLETQLLKTQTLNSNSREIVDKINAIIDDLIGENGEFAHHFFDSIPQRRGFVVRALKSRLTILLVKPVADENAPAVPVSAFHENQLKEIIGYVAKEMGLERTAESLESDLRKVESIPPAVVDKFLETANRVMQQYVVAQFIKKLLYDITLGWGPLSDLLKIPNVSEIMVVHPTCVYVERGGRLMLTNATFFDNETTMAVIERIISPLGRRVDRSQPLVDARLPDGSRVNAAVPPVATRGPCLTIRRFPTSRIRGEDLVARGTISAAALRLLKALVVARKNVIVAGGTGSGKTTLLNALSSLIPRTERIITVEDAAELRIDSPHVVTLESKPANAEGTGAISIHDLVRNALRMRPDRIIVGECRGEETLDMLQAMNTGHPGSMTTVHANSVHDVPARLETMVLMKQQMPLLAIRRQISQAIDVIVYIQRSAGTKRLVMQIAEVQGIDSVKGEIRICPIMDRDGGGDLRPTGYMPDFLDDLVRDGGLVLNEWFTEAQG